LPLIEVLSDRTTLSTHPARRLTQPRLPLLMARILIAGDRMTPRQIVTGAGILRHHSDERGLGLTAAREPDVPKSFEWSAEADATVPRRR
jgi:hypothetical protein